jgi:NTE family protein
MSSSPATPAASRRRRAARQSGLPGEVVLVFQGGGALGAYQVGVYEALHDSGIEPACPT